MISLTKKIGVTLILRLHPTERYEGADNVIIDMPSAIFAATTTKSIEHSNSDVLKFISLMKYSNVVINIASTVALDAIIFDTPVICVAYNTDSSFDLKWNNALEWYNSTHYKDVIDSEAVLMVRNLGELEKAVVKYLEDPVYLSEKRDIFSRNFCKIHYNVSAKILESLQ